MKNKTLHTFETYFPFAPMPGITTLHRYKFIQKPDGTYLIKKDNKILIHSIAPPDEEWKAMYEEMAIKKVETT